MSQQTQLEAIKKSISHFVWVGKVGGAYTAVVALITDVLRPLGQTSLYVAIIASGIALALLTSFLFLKKFKPALNENLQSLTKGVWFYTVFSAAMIACIVFTASYTINKDRKNGYLADNFEFARKIQSELGIISEGLTRIENKADKIIEQTESLSQNTDKIQEILKNVKKETSDDPKKELANRGINWSINNFTQCIETGDIENLKLFLQGGMDPNIQISGSGHASPFFKLFLNPPDNWKEVLDVAIKGGFDINKKQYRLTEKLINYVNGINHHSKFVFDISKTKYIPDIDISFSECLVYIFTFDKSNYIIHLKDIGGEIDNSVGVKEFAFENYIDELMNFDTKSDNTLICTQEEDDLLLFLSKLTNIKFEELVQEINLKKKTFSNYKIMYDNYVSSNKYKSFVKKVNNTEIREVNANEVVQNLKNLSRKSTIAAVFLGKLYEFGKDIEQNYVEAVDLYKFAAKYDNFAALNNLGVCYEKGLGVKSNKALAFEYYTQGAKLNYGPAIFNLGRCYLDGISVASDPKIAIDHFKKAAELGDSDALFELGACYMFGTGVREDIQIGAQYYQKAANAGNSLAMFRLGQCYETGRGVNKSWFNATSCFHKAAYDGLVEAQYYLGYWYSHGPKQLYDLEKSFYYYEIAAKQGHAVAQFKLGLAYIEGLGVNKNPSKAVEYYTMSANKEYELAQVNLGHCYENGIGVVKNLETAKFWYQKAANVGNPQAINHLKRLNN